MILKQKSFDGIYCLSEALLIKFINNNQYYFNRWEDYLQIPLQPLAENLDTHTYNVFEKDPVKYDQYQKAIAQALIHIKKKNCDSSSIVSALLFFLVYLSIPYYL